MRKIEVVTGVVIVTILCANYLYFRTDVAAQTGSETDVADLKSRIQTFFTALNNAQPGSQEAYQSAFKLLYTASQTQDKGISEMIDKTDDMIKGGNRWDYEFLDSKSVGTDLIQIRYLYNSDIQPFVWYFTFYRPLTGVRSSEILPASRKWNCIGIRFDNDIDTLFLHWSKTSP